MRLRSQTDMLKPAGFMQGRQTAALVGAIVVIMCCLSLDPFHTMNALEERQQARTEREVLQSELQVVAEQVDETNELLGSILDDTDGATVEATEKVEDTLDTLEDMEAVLEEKEIEAEEEIEVLEANHPGSGVTSRQSVPLVDTAWFKARLEDGMKLIVVHKWVVDVSQFILEHPGGDVFAVGEDNTMAYYNEHGCAPGILEKLAELTVAQLAGPRMLSSADQREEPEEQETGMAEEETGIEGMEADLAVLERRRLLQEGIDEATAEAELEAEAEQAETEGQEMQGGVETDVQAQARREEADAETEEDLELDMMCLDLLFLSDPAWDIEFSLGLFVGAMLIVGGVMLAVKATLASAAAHSAAERIRLSIKQTVGMELPSVAHLAAMIDGSPFGPTVDAAMKHMNVATRSTTSTSDNSV